MIPYSDGIAPRRFPVVNVALIVACRFERRLEDTAERGFGPLQGPGGCAPPLAAGASKRQSRLPVEQYRDR